MRNSGINNVYGSIVDVIDKTSSFTLTAQMNGAWIRVNSSGAVTVTVPPGLGEGFTCVLHNEGAGLITVSAGSGVTVNSAGSLVSASAQHAVLGLFAYSANVFNLSGSLA